MAHKYAESKRRHYLANKEAIQARRKASREADAEKEKAYNRAYYLANRERTLARVKRNRSKAALAELEASRKHRDSLREFITSRAA